MKPSLYTFHHGIAADQYSSPKTQEQNYFNRQWEVFSNTLYSPRSYVSVVCPVVESL